MTDTALLTIGPYRQGEIPPPIQITFETSADAPIDLSSGFLSRFEYRNRAGTVTERVPTVEADQVANKGKVTYPWVAADFATAGDFRGEIWVGNGVNRYASIKLAWFVEPAVAVPTI